MPVGLLRIEFLKLESMHWCEIWHMKLDTGLADCSLMQYALIIHAQIWVALKLLVLRQKVLHVQYGLQQEN
jgi:hypothetical protein